MSKVAHDAFYLAQLQGLLRPLAQPAGLRAVAGGAGAGLALGGGQGAEPVAGGACYLERHPHNRWTPTASFFARPLAEGPVPAGPPVLPTNGGDGHAIDAWLVRHPSRTVLVPVTGGFDARGQHPPPATGWWWSGTCRPGRAMW